MDRVLDRSCGAGEALSLLRRRAGRGPRPRRLLLAGTALAGALMFAPSLAQAQNATWTGSTGGNWNANANWLPASVPTGTATFDATGLTQAVTVTADASINTMLFSAGAPAYSYTINAGPTGVTFDIIGAGIVNNSANAPNFLNNGILNFSNSSTAANANITNNNTLNFNNSSTAGSATVINNNVMNFNNTSTAGSAGIINNAFLFFSNTSTAATATVLNNAAITFQDSTSAGSAAITNNGGGSLISFADTSTAGSSTITTNGGALTQFTGKHRRERAIHHQRRRPSRFFRNERSRGQQSGHRRLDRRRGHVPTRRQPAHCRQQQPIDRRQRSDRGRRHVRWRFTRQSRVRCSHALGHEHLHRCDDGQCRNADRGIQRRIADDRCHGQRGRDAHHRRHRAGRHRISHRRRIRENRHGRSNNHAVHRFG